MPLNKDIKKVLVIGSGPIVIGQAAEFDYAGTQACRALREDGIEIVLVNSNPATIMTDKAMADKIYIEPLNLTTIKRIIEKEKPRQHPLRLWRPDGPDPLHAAGQGGLLGEPQRAAAGRLPRDHRQGRGPPDVQGHHGKDWPALHPLQGGHHRGGRRGLRPGDWLPRHHPPAFTLGGSGGGIVNNQEELREVAANGLALSPITQILVEKSIAGWKEIEFEVMRDSKGNTITVCSMENLDPVGRAHRRLHRHRPHCDAV